MSSTIIAALVLVSLLGIARAEHRSALLIGNSNYPKAELASPTQDIRAVGAALQKRGFVVTQVENLAAKELAEAFKSFARTVPTRGTALVYFSGYAIASGKADDLNADTILLPIDGGTPQMGTRFLLDSLILQSGSAANILIIDGCYARPDQSPNSPRGLIKSGKLAPNSLLIYAAPMGEVLEPVVKGMSPLAKNLSDALNSSKPLNEVLAQSSPTQESTIENLSVLAAPASKAVSSSAELRPGTKAGDEWVSDLGMVFCWCPPGKFTMGSASGSLGSEADEVPSNVEFSTGFWIGKFEFTRRELFTLTNQNQGAYLSTGDHKLHPLNKLRPDSPATYLMKLNETAPSGWQYVLPTEAEWEYAARAGTSTAYSFGDDPAELAKHGNFADRTLRESDSFGEIAKNWKPKGIEAPIYFGDRQTGLFSYAHKTWSDGHATMAPVGSFPPNPWGLHDVYGNLSELTSTAYHAQRTPPEKFDDRIGWVCKGGSWLSTASSCRSAFRGQFTFHARENSTENYLGVRFVLRKKAGSL